MALYRKRPIKIEAVEFGVDFLPEEVVIKNSSEGSMVYNELHDSWIKINFGDMIRVDQAPEDVYPIDRETFDQTYEKVE